MGSFESLMGDSASFYEIEISYQDARAIILLHTSVNLLRALIS